MIGTNLGNNNSGSLNFFGNPQAITTTGNYCQIVTGWPNVIDSVYYKLVAGAGVTAINVTIQTVRLFTAGGFGGGVLSMTWDTVTTPNSATGAAYSLIAGTAPGVYMGSLNVSNSIFVPSMGVRLNVTTLTGGNITYAELLATCR